MTKFSRCNFVLICLGGVAEFGTSLFSILAFNQATMSDVNAGVAGVLIPASGIFVSAASFFIFREKLQVTQVIGLFVIIAGATVIAMFPAEDTTSGVKASTAEVLIVLLFSMLATLSLSFEIVISKLLSKRGADGRYIGFHFLLSEGILGTLCLVITTLVGEGIFIISQENFWLMIIGGLSGVIAVNLL